MRAHKYRAWDKHTKVMSYWVNVYSDNGKHWWSADVVNPENGDTQYSFDENSGVLEEFSGTQDKKGVDIYEGDKVIAYGVTGRVGVVKFLNCGFVIEWGGDPGDISLLGWYNFKRDFESKPADFEVIGNIHQD